MTTQSAKGGIWRWYSLLLHSFVFALLLLLGIEWWTRDWLFNRATLEEQRKYGTLELARIRSEAGKTAFYKYEPHRYIGYVPAANFVNSKNRHNSIGFRGDEFPRENPRAGIPWHAGKLAAGAERVCATVAEFAVLALGSRVRLKGRSVERGALRLRTPRK